MRLCAPSWSWLIGVKMAEECTDAAIEPDHEASHADHETVQHILQRLNLDKVLPDVLSDRLDRVLLHPVFGPIILAALLFLIFQAMFSLATIPMDAIKAATDWLGQTVTGLLPDNWVRSLLVNGIIAGAGGVVVFLPQILILFFFILILEESGYLPRAAFLLDRIMGSVGLSGRSFIPLLSSFACAIPGIMATRTIANQRDRMVTIMIAPLMTCSARLPVYALLIGAFIPQKRVWMGLELQGVVLFLLYVAGIAGAMAVAWLLKRFASDKRQFHPLMMELPSYHWPTARNVLIGLWQRVKIFMRRVGGVILVLTIALWFLASYPGAPAGATGAAIEYSFAGMLGKALAVVFAPIGFNWQISVALVPGLAAREVAISSLGTVYALSATADERRPSPRPAHRPKLEPGDRLVAAGLVRLRPAMFVDFGSRQTRNRQLENARHHRQLPVRAGLRGVVYHVSGGGEPGMGLNLAVAGVLLPE